MSDLPWTHKPLRKAKKPYLLVRQYGTNKRRKIDGFDTYEEALKEGEATNPGTDGQLVPNVDDKAPAGYEYDKGIFWAGQNRYAIIYMDKSRIH